MSTAAWVVPYIVQALLWLPRWGGARAVVVSRPGTIEGWRAPLPPRRFAHLIKVFAWLLLAASTVRFVLGRRPRTHHQAHGLGPWAAFGGSGLL